MVYPKVTPWTRPQSIFHQQQPPKTYSDAKKPPPDPDTHPLFGTALNDTEWPGNSEYQDKFKLCHIRDRAVGGVSRGSNPQRAGGLLDRSGCLPWPCGPKIEERFRDRGIEEYQMAPKVKPQQQRIDQLYNPTPQPILEKRYTGEYYRINDPVGKAITKTEITKCRDTVFGPVHVGQIDEMSKIYFPNYRYKEWVNQPQIEIQKQNSMTNPLCRMPEADPRHYDLYHVRAGQPAPKINQEVFGACAVIPLPRNDA